MRLASTTTIGLVTVLASLARRLGPKVFGNVDFFGFRILPAGDIDGDGVPELVVGAPGRDVAGRRCQGQVFIFRGADGTLLRTLDAPVAQDLLSFGYALALMGGADGEGAPGLVVGAPGCDVGGRRCQGQVFIFDGRDGTLLRTLDHPRPQPYAQFGRPVVGMGDGGGAAVIVGAPWQDVGGCRHQGQVFVFRADDGTLIRTLDDPTAQPRAYFGRQIAVLHDRGRQARALAVAAPHQHAGGGYGQGQVFIFDAVDGTLIRALVDPLPQAGARFGRMIAAVGDLDGDGVEELVVGAPRHTVDGRRRQGRAFVFSGADGTLLYALDDPQPQAGARFGDEVAGVDDLNGDGLPEVAAAARLQDVDGNRRQGQVFIFNGANGQLMRTLSDPVPSPGARFGRSIASLRDLNGDGISEIAVAAPHQEVDGLDQGQVFVFSGADGALLFSLSPPPLERVPAWIQRFAARRRLAARMGASD